MSVSHRYRDFGKKPKKTDLSETELNTSVEDEKLKSFDAGYQAGWDDAIKAQQDDSNRIKAEFAQNLQDISFSYHEASAKISASVEPIFRQVVEKILPEIARKTLGLHIVEQVMNVASATADSKIEIVASPDNVESLRALLEDNLPDPFDLVGDAALNDEQVFVRVSHEERRIDLNAIIDGVSKATDAFFHEIKEKKSDG